MRETRMKTISFDSNVSQIGIDKGRNYVTRGYKLIPCFRFQASLIPPTRNRQVSIAVSRSINSSRLSETITISIKIFLAPLLDESWALEESKRLICTFDNSQIVQDVASAASMQQRAFLMRFLAENFLVPFLRDKRQYRDIVPEEHFRASCCTRR